MRMAYGEEGLTSKELMMDIKYRLCWDKERVLGGKWMKADQDFPQGNHHYPCTMGLGVASWLILTSSC